YTLINKEHPATKAGTITSIDIWASTNITGLIVGTFYTRNGNTLKCRASQAIEGTITAGDLVNKVVSIAAEIGDYIGFYATNGFIEADLAGYAGVWLKVGEYIDPDDEEDYTFSAGIGFSLGGYLSVTHIWEGSDGIQVGDVLIKNPIKVLIDAIAFTDTLIKNPIKVLADGFAFTDTLVKMSIKVLSDAFAFTDTLVKYKTMFRTYTDGFAFTDTLIKSTAKILSDSIAFVDCLVRWRWLAAVRNLTRRRCTQPSVREQNPVDDGNI
ncbi:unnamed protein product, partial [marine sediment metagenome]